MSFNIEHTASQIARMIEWWGTDEIRDWGESCNAHSKALKVQAREAKGALDVFGQPDSLGLEQEVNCRNCGRKLAATR